MNPKKRFFLGGAGALLPVLVSFIALDIGAILSQDSSLKAGIIIGFFIRYFILFGVGGFVAYLHDDENKPFKIVEFGIAAPALITSLITAQAINIPTPTTVSYNFSIVSSAYAGDSPLKTGGSPVLLAGLFNDIGKGITGSAYKDIVRKPVEKSVEQTVVPVKKPVGKSVEQTVVPAVKPVKKVISTPQAITNSTSGQSQNNPEKIGILEMEAETARTKAEAFRLKAEAAKINAKVAKAKADALEKEYTAIIAQVEAAEAVASELKMKLLNDNSSTNN